MDDLVLLSRYVGSGCQESFQEIVTRHSGWVFSLSLRAVRDRHLAEDVTQAVFIVLARKARTIRQGTPLSGWLFKVSRFAVSDALKRRARIKNRENRFAEFFKATPAGMENDNIADGVSQTLDEAVACLSESDRQAVLLRFYEHKSLAEIGTILDISEEAAKKRVARAVERLRKYFSTRGIIASVALLLLLLSQRSAQAANFLPVIPSAAPSLANAIAEGALKLMAHANARLLGAILAAGLALLIAVPTLGGALVRGIVSTPAPSPVPVKPLPIPAIPYETQPVNHLKLPAEPRFADLWIGYKGEMLWRSDAYTGPPAVPFYLKSAESLDRPYAVAVDGKGNFFLRPLDRGFLQSPVIRQPTFDYDNGPIEPAARVQSMLSAIDLMPPEDSGSADVRNEKLLPKIDPEKDKGEWEKLHRQDSEGGPTIVERAPFMPSNFNGLNDSSTDIQSIEVPEPTAAHLILAGTGLLTLRRRRRT